MKGHVRWNEANIGEIEASKPVRPKITEPKTPYHPMIDDDSPSSPLQRDVDECFGDDNHFANAERTGFNDATCCRKGTRQSDGWTSSEDEDEVIEDEDRSSSFKEHRKAHYNEFLKVKKLQKNASAVEDESDEDNNVDLTVGEKKNDPSFSTSGT